MHMGLSSKQVSSDHLELNWTQNMLTSNMMQSSSNPPSTTTKRSLVQTQQQQQPEPLKCPRCDSANTKFCYYNNYNKTQPRHYCKACKRHWTKGGTLRNVPVGGGRKNKRAKRPNTTTTSTNTTMDRNLGLLGDQKYMFQDDKGMFFKPNDSKLDQVSWSFNGGFSGTSTTMQQMSHQNLGFSIHSSLSSMDTNPIPNIPTSSYSPLLAGFKDNSTITTTRMMMPNSINVSQPWMQAPAPAPAPTTSNFLEANYWTWNDIDSLVQSDLNKSFEDSHMKP